MMNELRKHEKELLKAVQSYLNERGEEGIRIDENTLVTITRHEKKIKYGKKVYEERVRQMLSTRGIDDEIFCQGLLNKTRDVVQEQKILIKK
jgi:hypothetical protein